MSDLPSPQDKDSRDKDSRDKDWKILEARPAKPGSSRIVCVANQKGGVAKTTSTVNLAAGLAMRGHRVLVIDLDPQANATTGLGFSHGSMERSSYDLILGREGLSRCTVPTRIRGLELVPSSLDLAGAEVELVGEMVRERKLAEALAAGSDHALVFIDCPPSLGLLTINALVAAHDLIVPVQCEYYALEGLGQLLRTAERLRRALNPELRIAGFLLTMFDGRTKLAGQVAEEVRSHFGELVFRTLIPRSVRLSEAPSFGEPVLTLDPSSRGSVAYRLLAAEVEERYGLPVHTPEAPRPDAKPPPPPPPPAPGPGGRGYGTTTPQPPALESSWPPRVPWEAGVPVTEPAG